MASSKTLTAAGGVLWRSGLGGTEVLLVHRPQQDDWSFPKGKSENSEHLLQTAVREVTEETGLRFSVGPRLGMISYPVKGRQKQVTYWSMALDSEDPGTAQPHDPGEIDQTRWFGLAKARSHLTYTEDRQILDAFATSGTPALSLVLIRHASAGSRRKWQGPDRLRPLDAQGITDAAALGQLISCFAPRRLLSAPLTRCVQTAQPISAITGLPAELSADLTDAAWKAEPDRVSGMISDLASSPGSQAVISQGDVIGAVLDELLGQRPGGHPRRKGSAWVFFAHDGRLSGYDYYPSFSASADRGE